MVDMETMHHTTRFDYIVSALPDGIHVFKNATAWVENGQLHREDGPAVITKNGRKDWWMNGELHRVGGPAIEYSNGDKTWIQLGGFWRADGPALEHTNGYVEWWLGRKFDSFDEWFDATPASDETKTMLKLEYG